MADGEVDGFADLIEQLTVFRFVNGVQIRTDEFDAQPFKRSVVGQFAGDVQGGLPAHPGQQSTRPFLLQDLGNGLGKQRLDVDDVGHLRVVLDGGRVGVDEDDLVAVLTQSPDGLGAREVELSRLADLDRSASKHHDGLKVVTTGHQFSPPR